MLYVAQLLLPDAGQLARLQQIFVDDVDKVETRRRGYEILALATYIAPLEQRLYDAGTRRRTAYAVLFHRRPQRLVLYKTPCRLHGAQQRGLGVGLRGLRPFLRERGRVRALLALDEGGEGAGIGRSLVFRHCRLLENDTPALGCNHFA